MSCLCECGPGVLAAGWDAYDAFNVGAIEGHDTGGRGHISRSWHIIQVVQVLWMVMAASRLALGAVGTFWYVHVASMLVVHGWG